MKIAYLGSRVDTAAMRKNKEVVDQLDLERFYNVFRKFFIRRIATYVASSASATRAAPRSAAALARSQQAAGRSSRTRSGVQS